MIKKFSVNNYRNVSVRDIELGKINLLIGPNGSGKSNFLKALHFWARLIQNKAKLGEGTTALFETLSQNNWNRMLKFNAADDIVDFSWAFSPDAEGHDYLYDLQIHMDSKSVSHADFYITSETFARELYKVYNAKPFEYFKCHGDKPQSGLISYYDADNWHSVLLDVRNNETTFLQLEELRNKDAHFDECYRHFYAERMSKTIKYLSRFFCYSCSDFNLNEIKTPVKNTQAAFMTSDARNLVNILQKWSQDDYATFYDYRKMIAPLFGEVHPIDVFIDPISQTNDCQLTLGVGKQKYVLNDLSDGQIRGMIMAALLVNRSEEMSVCSIDEPEINLHPEWQCRFSEWLLSSDASRQFFISSHSPEILDPLTPAFMKGEVKLFVFKDGHIKQCFPEEIKELYDDGFNIGDLYRAKAIEIGGWPK